MVTFDVINIDIAFLEPRFRKSNYRKGVTDINKIIFKLLMLARQTSNIDVNNRKCSMRYTKL